jgi:cob(I)alamin adenosyltransferase
VTTNDEQLMRDVDTLLSHVWMVRAFLKHSEEAEEDEELREVHRELYDYMHALGPLLSIGDATGYLKMARKKLKRLRKANEFFQEIQPEISSHTNFQMAAASLNAAAEQVETLLAVQ